MVSRRKVLEGLKDLDFEVRCESHAAAILEKDFPAAVAELGKVLSALTIPISEIIGSGGGETKGTQRMRHAFNDAGWKKYVFEVRKIINGEGGPGPQKAVRLGVTISTVWLEHT
jgi:hypothetical protein